MQLSHVLDEEDTLYATIIAAQQDLQQNNLAHLDGMLYALGCLCREMEFLENEELVQVTLDPPLHVASLPFFPDLAMLGDCTVDVFPSPMSCSRYLNFTFPL